MVHFHTYYSHFNKLYLVLSILMQLSCVTSQLLMLPIHYVTCRYTSHDPFLSLECEVIYVRRLIQTLDKIKHRDTFSSSTDNLRNPHGSSDKLRNYSNALYTVYRSMKFDS